MNRTGFAGTCLAFAMVFAATAAFAGTLDQIKSSGELKCGVNPNLPGFSYVDAKGERQGFDIDFCRALAAAIGVTPKFIPSDA